MLVSHVAEVVQAKKIRQYTESLEPGAGHVIGLYYDATPAMLNFTHSSLREKLTPLAKDCMKDFGPLVFREIEWI